MSHPRIPRLRRAQVIGLPRDTANDPTWEPTRLVTKTSSRPYRDVKPCPPCTGECETLGRQCPAPAKLPPAAAALAWFLGMTAFVVACAGIAAAVAGVGWLAAVVLPAVLDTLGVALLTWMGIV